MRHLLLFSLFVLCLGFTSCIEDTENLAAPAVTQNETNDSPERSVSYTFQNVEENCGFACTSGMITNRTEMPNRRPLVTYTTSYFLTVNDVTENGKARGISNMIQVDVTTHSGNPIDRLQMNFDSHPLTTLVGQDVVLVHAQVINGMDFESGSHGDNLRIEHGWITMSTDPWSGEQSFWFDAETRTGRKVYGKWTGNVEQVEVPFLEN